MLDLVKPTSGSWLNWSKKFGGSALDADFFQIWQQIAIACRLVKIASFFCFLFCLYLFNNKTKKCAIGTVAIASNL